MPPHGVPLPSLETVLPLPSLSDTQAGRAGYALQQARAIAEEAALAAPLHDREASFPTTAVAALGDAGLLAAPLPLPLGGSGLHEGTALLLLLHAVGSGSMALGRIFEAHINALRLVTLYGSADQQLHAAGQARAGKLFAVWVTDAPDAPLRLNGESLFGAKQFCSAAGYADMAVITADAGNPEAVMMMVPTNTGVRVAASGPSLQGVRAAVTRRVEFDGCRATVLGRPGDYLREPEFSTGAWRAAAVTLGGLAALLDEARRQIKARGLDAAPHQRARLGRAAIAHHTGFLWLERAAMLCAAGIDAADAVAYVNLARTAFEAAAMDALAGIERSLGLGAFLQGNPAERLARDVATYLRQPAPDEALDEASGHFMRRPIPGAPS